MPRQEVPRNDGNANTDVPSYVGLDWEKGKPSCGTIVDFRKTATADFLDNLKDTTRSDFKDVFIKNLSLPPLREDVRELQVYAWPYGRFAFLSTIQSKTGKISNNYGYRVEAQPDGSYLVKFRYRCYYLAGMTFPLYVLIDYDNQDPVGSLPRLIQPNIRLNKIDGGTFTLILEDVYETRILAAADITGKAYTPERTIYYTLDGSQPTTSSSQYNRNNPPTIPLTNNLQVKVFSTAVGWFDSEIRTAFVNTDNIPYVDPSYFVAPILVENNSGDEFSIYNWNSDSLYVGYDDFRLAIEFNISLYDYPRWFVSYDGGLSFTEYFDTISLPSGWKTPVGKAGFPSLIVYVQDFNSNRSQYYFQKFSFVYPNTELQLKALNPELFIINGNNITFNGTNEFSFSGYEFKNMSQTDTFLDDFRYFEILAFDNDDEDGIIKHNINGVVFNGNGDVIANSATQPPEPLPVVRYPSLFWDRGDLLRVWFNYRNGDVKLAVNQEEFVGPFHSSRTYTIGASYVDTMGSFLGSTEFRYFLKIADLTYPLPNALTIPLDTTGYGYNGDTQSPEQSFYSPEPF